MGLNVTKTFGADTKLTSGQTLATPTASPVLANSLLIPGPGRLFSITVFNTGPTQYIQLFDGAVTPVDGNVPEVQVKVLADDDRSEDYGDGIIFRNGIYICNSTTSGTKTIGAANCLIRAQFRLGRTALP